MSTESVVQKASWLGAQEEQRSQRGVAEMPLWKVSEVCWSQKDFVCCMKGSVN